MHSVFSIIHRRLFFFEGSIIPSAADIEVHDFFAAAHGSTVILDNLWFHRFC
jgi:hypothetical protein